MNTYYITFGAVHIDKNGNSLLNCYTTIEAENRTAAREKIFSEYGKKWAFMYDSPEEAGIMEYNLIYVAYELLV
jgi:hypothetical protein